MILISCSGYNRVDSWDFYQFIFLQAFCSLLKRDIALSFKAKGNPLASVLSCNLLMNAFSEEENWPDTFVKVNYILPSKLIAMRI